MRFFVAAVVSCHEQGHGISSLLDDAACVMCAGVSELRAVMDELKELKEQLKKLGAGDPERIPLRQQIVALQEDKNRLMLKADQGGRQV